MPKSSRGRMENGCDLRCDLGALSRFSRDCAPPSRPAQRRLGGSSALRSDLKRYGLLLARHAPRVTLFVGAKENHDLPRLRFGLCWHQILIPPLRIIEEAVQFCVAKWLLLWKEAYREMLFALSSPRPAYAI
jgi:hypothetical protein